MLRLSDDLDFFADLLTVPRLMTATTTKNQKAARSTNVNHKVRLPLLTQAADEAGQGITLVEDQDHSLDPERETMTATVTENGRNHEIETGRKKETVIGIKGQEVRTGTPVHQSWIGDPSDQGPGLTDPDDLGPDLGGPGDRDPGLVGPGDRDPDLVDQSDRGPGLGATGQEAEVDHVHHLWTGNHEE